MRFSLPFFRGVNDLDEIVFEYRNKSYGAYELRQHYHERLQKALLIVISSLALLTILIFYLQNRKPPEQIRDGWTFTIDSVKPLVIEQTLRKIQPPPPSPPASSQSPPVVLVHDSAITEHQQVDTTSVADFRSGVSNDTAGNNSGSEISSVAGNNGTGEENTIQTQVEDQNKIIITPEVMPSFPGGSQGLSRYLRMHFDCDGSGRNGFSNEGKIILKFVVMKDGTIKDMTVMQETVSIDCVERLKEVLLDGPKWNPGLQNNQAVNVLVVQPVTFAVQ